MISSNESSQSTSTGRRHLSKLFVKYPVSTFLILTFTLGWAYIFTTRAVGDSVVRDLFFLFCGPSVSAFIVTTVMWGKKGLACFMKSLLKWRVPGKYYFLAIVGIPLWIFVASYAVTLALFPQEMRLPPMIQIVASLFNFIITFIFAGLGEEFGWRGFALPRLQKKLGALGSSLLLGILWAIWHLPWWIESAGWQTGFLMFSVEVIMGSFIYTWLYNQTKQSILPVALLHGAVNASWTTWIVTFDFAPTGSLFYEGVKMAAWILAAAVVILLTQGRLGHESN